MARVEASILALAHAKATVLSHGAHPRVAARKSDALTADHLNNVEPAILLMLSDDARRDEVLNRAAATAHAHRIAQAISGGAREKLAEIVSNQARQVALQHRGLAYASCDEASFEIAFVETANVMQSELMHFLRGEKSSNAPARACIEAALEASK